MKQLIKKKYNKQGANVKTLTYIQEDYIIESGIEKIKESKHAND